MPSDEQFSDVPITFLCADEQVSVRSANVILRNDLFIIDMERIDRLREAYLLNGERTEYGFAGKNHSRTNTVDVNARWASIGAGAYVGHWVENGRVYLFCFDLNDGK